jgi:hypothetical protein
MDKLSDYRSIVQTVIKTYADLGKQAFEIKPKSASVSSTEAVVIFDDRRDRYLLMIMGWHGEERINSTMIHVRLHNGKIWIEEDWTEDGVATDFLQAGVPPEDIILAFHPPQLRQYTDFATA